MMDRLMVSVSGVRGTIGFTLGPEVACRFGCAFGTMLGGGTVVLGRDSRPSGPMIRDAVAAGLMATGVDVIDLGIVSTPGVALMTSKLRADGGVVVTASHNPIQYNGIKFLQPSGTALTAEAAGRLEEIWRSGQFTLADVTAVGGESQDATTHESHIAAVCAVTDVEAISRRRFEVVLDSVNGAGCEVTPMFLDRLGCRVTLLNGEPTGKFAHPPEPIEENLDQLCRAVASSGAAVGFAQDADADRLAIVDEMGRFIGEEYTLALATAFILRHRTGKVATNLMTSRMIDDVAATAGCEVVRTPTGEANVVEGMGRFGCVFGGEGGGGVIDPQVVPVRDSLVAMACVLGYMSETGKTISELVDEIPRYSMIKIKMPCPRGVAAEVAQAVREAFGTQSDARFNDADGLRIDLPNRWVCVRASNTEPIIRIVAEAPEQQAADEIVAQVRRIAEAVIAAAGGE